MPPSFPSLDFRKHPKFPLCFRFSKQALLNLVLLSSSAQFDLLPHLLQCTDCWYVLQHVHSLSHGQISHMPLIVLRTALPSSVRLPSPSRPSLALPAPLPAWVSASPLCLPSTGRLPLSTSLFRFSAP